MYQVRISAELILLLFIKTTLINVTFNKSW